MDTMVICTITGLSVVIFDLGLPDYAMNGFGGLEGSDLAIAAFSNGLGSWGGYGIAIATVLFAGSTIFGWSYYGEKALEYLFKDSRTAVMIYKIIFCFAVILGSVGSLSLMWNIADTLNGLMAIPNLIGLLFLSPIVVKLTKDFFEKGLEDEE